MFSLFNFSSIFPVGSVDPICPYVRTPMSAHEVYSCVSRICRYWRWRQDWSSWKSCRSASPPTTRRQGGWISSAPIAKTTSCLSVGREWGSLPGTGTWPSMELIQSCRRRRGQLSSNTARVFAVLAINCSLYTVRSYYNGGEVLLIYLLGPHIAGYLFSFYLTSWSRDLLSAITRLS